jgi:hypothetical protein
MCTPVNYLHARYIFFYQKHHSSLTILPRVWRLISPGIISSCLFAFISSTQSEHMIYATWRAYAKSYLNFLPYKRTHSTKRYCTVSYWLQKQYFSFSHRFYLTKLVSITFLYNSPKKTLIFKGIFSFHKKILCGIISKSRSVWYIELTKNWPLDLNDHLKMFGSSFKYIFAILKTDSWQECKFALTSLLKEMFSGLVLGNVQWSCSKNIWDSWI